ncbi:Hypothetical protein R9X50_00036700 [Acrodontium crateriforme]|uniref:O-methyltransferase n=1 Tax=Acrodontium crateriforme TaxID=150365 RepID=A0AAQ3LYP0_9PEZI|nr:Hypothetical protein R9X50_00036700 [Acrodontium crateriforme]
MTERQIAVKTTTHERNERWTAVDQYASHHLLPIDTPLAAALKYASELSARESLPNIEVSRQQGKFLALQCMISGAKNVLEVGTLGGYSSIWLASASPDVKITTIEIDPKHKAVAEQAIAHAGLSDRITVLLGAGADVLPKLRTEIEAGTREKFGFVFIDADKPSNLTYLNEAVPMCLPRSVIIVDNVVRRGQLADAEVAKTDAKVAGARQVVEAAGKDHRLDACLLQTVGEKNYDGFMIKF